MTAPPETAATRKNGGDEEARPLAQTRAPERRQRRIRLPRGASPPVRAAPRRRRHGGPCSGSLRGVVGVAAAAGSLGTAWRGTGAASGRGFWRRQAVDLSRRPHLVSSMFRSGLYKRGRKEAPEVLITQLKWFQALLGASICKNSRIMEYQLELDLNSFMSPSIKSDKKLIW
ncbi:uncharacterized protein [Triticum aestivum]|uniref:uncharacterized protein isoform X2 n=1 Tax=Triticum aestivum TaxID=4565 RepID=UPI00098A0638|nr:uncharacterized protein LOC109743124 isoform X2 [Aegilops tauschii subsp. strangulata]XP_044439505.1 uncharacterized protein LOC123165833 isoform X2 [Triticum aestivum]